MTIARKSLRAAVFLATVLLGGPAAAQQGAFSFVDDPGVDTLGTGVAERIPSDQPGLLEEALERYREIERSGGWREIPTNLVMGPGQSYDCRRVNALEKRLIMEGYLEHESPAPAPPPAPALSPAEAQAQPVRAAPVRADQPMGLWGPCPYTSELTDAVRAFQADRRVLGVGQLGTQTMAELNRPVQEIVEILEQDLTRWRARGLNPRGTYLLVNIPFFELSVFEDDEETMRMPVVVGQPTWQTPRFSDELEYIIVNPDWGIPDKIARQEYWPSARRDPEYFRWQGITNTGGSLRQKPGPRNPLGRIKFVMPNENDVYLHDTPEKRAFAAKNRSLSHGCIRLSRPLDLAIYLLRDDPQWGSRRIESAIGSGQTRQINLHRRMPVHIVYSTSRVNEAGRVEFRDDVYKTSRRVEPRQAQALHGGDEGLAAWP